VCSRKRFAGKRIVEMFGFLRFARRLSAAAAAVALAVTIAPAAAGAQDAVPSYARPAVVSTDETIHGRIRSVDGAFTLSVDDDRGFIDEVLLHQGTIINPTGLTLSPGMSVTILGYNAGDTFDANEIDTPYSYDGPLPTPMYYGPGYWCPGFAYGYGPSFSLAIVFDSGRPWYYEHRPYRGRPWDGRRYFGTEVARRIEPHVRLEQRPAHAPAAFEGRSFAGESRVAPERFGTTSTSNAPTSSRRYEETRGNVNANRHERSMPTVRAAGSGRGVEPMHAAGGAAHSEGSARGGGGGSGGGGAHAAH
jgi:hypothetical protein